MDKVFVNGLKVNCIVGINPEERVKPQDLLIDLTLQYPSLIEAGTSGDLAHSADYAVLSAQVKEFVLHRQAELLETLGSELCDLILKEFHPAAVTVRLTKTQAVPDTLGTGIEISKKA